MITAYVFDSHGQHTIENPDSISELIKKNNKVVWADLQTPTVEDTDRLREEFGLHPLAIEDVVKHGQRPKMEIYEDHGFLVAYASCANSEDLREIDVFIGSNWLVTVHEHDDSGDHFDMGSVRARCARTLPKHMSVAFLLYTVLDEIVDTYFDALEVIGEEIDDIEERVFSDENPELDERPTQREMLKVRKKLLMFRRRVVPLREVLLMLLRDDLSFIDRASHHYFQDILDHVMRITDEIDNRRELIGNAVDAHLAMVSNQMNQTMKRMTSWGAILIVGTLVAGIYGMNFKNMPELEWEYGYFIALGTMFGAMGLLYLYFKRKHWM